MKDPKFESRNPKLKSGVRRTVCLCLLSSALCFWASGQFAIDWHTIDGGGGTSTGGVYTGSGTIGQPDARTTPMTGGQYSMGGGFWSFLAQLVSPKGEPVLTVQSSNNQLIVTWPLAAADFCLETTYGLEPPVAWQQVTGGITTNGDSLVFSLAIDTGVPKQFFRLVFPCSSVPEAVALSFELSGAEMVVSWPGGGFRLETTYNLAPPPVVWQTLSNGIVSGGGLNTYTFTNNPAVTNQFFRLAYP